MTELDLTDEARTGQVRWRLLYEDDLARGMASVYLPDALERKYPNVATDWIWQYIFVVGSYSIDPRSGIERCHHMDEKLLQRAMKKAVLAAGLTTTCSMKTLNEADNAVRCVVHLHPHWEQEE